MKTSIHCEWRTLRQTNIWNTYEKRANGSDAILGWASENSADKKVRNRIVYAKKRKKEYLRKLGNLCNFGQCPTVNTMQGKENECFDNGTFFMWLSNRSSFFTLELPIPKIKPADIIITWTTWRYVEIEKNRRIVLNMRWRTEM